MLAVKVKWGSSRFEGVELDPTRKPLDFKRRLAELSGVAPPRQQLMFKGALVKDDDSWASHSVKNGSTLMLVGSTRPSCSDGAPSTATSARGCCVRCGDAARDAGNSLWWLLMNIFPLMFSFFWTMFDKNAGAAGNRIAIQRRHQQLRATPPPRLDAAVPDGERQGGSGGGSSGGDGGGGGTGTGRARPAAPTPSCRTNPSGAPPRGPST